MVVVKKIKVGKYIATVIVVDLKNTSFLELNKVFKNEYNRLKMANCYGLKTLLKLMDEVHEKQKYTEVQKAYILKKLFGDTNLEDGYLHFYIYNMIKDGYKCTNGEIFTHPDIDMAWLEDEISSIKLSDQ